MNWTAKDIERDYFEPQTIADAFNENNELTAKNKALEERVAELDYVLELFNLATRNDNMKDFVFGLSMAREAYDELKNKTKEG